MIKFFIHISLFFVLAGMSYQYYQMMKESIFLEFQAGFLLQTQEFKTHLQERMLAYESVLTGTTGLFQASEFVERVEFKRYVDALKLDTMFPGIQGVGYSAVVLPQEKDTYIAKVRAEGFNSFVIYPATPRDFYTAITYLEPFTERNQRAFGFDMFSEPIRRAAMQQAMDTSTTTISKKVKLMQEKTSDVQAGFLMYVPLYKKNRIHETLEQRREHIQGWIYAPFRMNDLMRGLRDYEYKNLDIEIYDSEEVSDKSLLYDSFAGTNTSLLNTKMEVKIAGRSWSIFVKSTPALEQKLDYSKAELILVFGILFAMFLVYIIWQLVNFKEFAEEKTKKANEELKVYKKQLQILNKTLEQQVEDKTQELQKTNELLEEHIVDLQSLNAKLTKAKEAALQAAQARSNFISSISHELRTPLNAIINFTDQVIEDFDEMLEDKELQEDTKAFLGRVLINSRHLLQLINDLLEFTKIEAGKMDYCMEENNVNTIAKMAYNNTYSLLNGTNIEFYFKPYETELIGFMDARRFLQILLNLLSNAIKFTDKGYIELRTYPEAEYIIVEVEDTGKGIALEKQKMIFEPFMQVNNTDNGTGLGLGLAKRMCEDMQIKISFISVEDKGTIFRLMLQKK